MKEDTSGILATIISGFCFQYIYHLGDWKLLRDHSYYYQVQTQLNVCNVLYGDFVVWTESGIAIERIIPDRDFFEDAADKVEHFFVYGILPEIIGKWYTRKQVADDDNIVRIAAAIQDHSLLEEDPEKCWCYCGQPSYGQMIMCEHENCKIEWFHFDCLRIRCPPKTEWYCPSCRKKPKSLSKRKPKKQSSAMKHTSQ